ncbi:MAG: hypothetical protein JNN13_13265 [Planctomycetes bacterium]|nr:hypothetical protein [Planctomycetota bacterium]
MAQDAPTRHPRPWQWLVVAAVLLVPPTLLLVAWFDTAAGERMPLLGTVLYWSMPVVLLLVVIAAVGRLRGRTLPFAAVVRWLAPGVLLAAAVVGLVLGTVPTAMRQQFDETCLVSASQNMHTQRAAWITTAAVPFHGAPLALENLVDKRPPLFAFLVSLLHDLTGYRVSNVFVLNAGLLGLGLVLAFVFVRQRLGLVAACAAPWLLWAVPLTAVVATSAGFELLATVLLLLLLLAAADFVRQPDAPRWAGLLGAGLLFAQARYESLPAFGLLLALVAWHVKGRFRPGFGGWLLLAAVVAAMTPLVLLLQHAQNAKFYPEASGQPLLSLANLLAHTPKLLQAWFSLRADNVLPGLLAWLAVGGLVHRLANGRPQASDGLVALPVVALTVVVLAWFYGDAGEPTALRLFLPLAWATALAPLLVVAVPGRRATFAVLALPLLAVGVRLVGGGSATPVPRFAIAEIVAAIDALAAQHDPEPGRTLWVATTAQSLIVHGHAAMNAATFERRRGELQQLARQGDLRTIFVVESPLDAAMAPEHGSPHDLALRSLADVVARGDGPQAITVYRLRW